MNVFQFTFIFSVPLIFLPFQWVVPTKYVSFHLYFPSFAPLFVTGDLSFSAAGYTDELVNILQAPLSFWCMIAFKLSVVII
jgi:hypothetical protein